MRDILSRRRRARVGPEPAADRMSSPRRIASTFLSTPSCPTSGSGAARSSRAAREGRRNPRRALLADVGSRNLAFSARALRVIAPSTQNYCRQVCSRAWNSRAVVRARGERIGQQRLDAVVGASTEAASSAVVGVNGHARVLAGEPHEIVQRSPRRRPTGAERPRSVPVGAAASRVVVACRSGATRAARRGFHPIRSRAAREGLGPDRTKRTSAGLPRLAGLVGVARSPGSPPALGSLIGGRRRRSARERRALRARADAELKPCVRHRGSRRQRER